MRTISVLLVEETRVLRDLLALTLNDQPDMHVLATGHDPRVVVSTAIEMDPTVVLVGISSREHSGLRLIRRLRATVPATRIVAMDFRPSDMAVIDFMGAGAHGFILQDSPIANLLHVIRSVAAAAPPEEVDHAVIESTRPRSIQPEAAAFDSLTIREREVASLIIHGRCNKDIARELDVSLHTVKAHVRSILEKLSLDSRLEIAAYAHHDLSHGHVTLQD